jgi:hypothetical protein
LLPSMMLNLCQYFSPQIHLWRPNLKT